jgi:hypothetical protein
VRRYRRHALRARSPLGAPSRLSSRGFKAARDSVQAARHANGRVGRYPIIIRA